MRAKIIRVLYLNSLVRVCEQKRSKEHGGSGGEGGYEDPKHEGSIYEHGGPKHGGLYNKRGEMVAVGE